MQILQLQCCPRTWRASTASLHLEAAVVEGMGDKEVGEVEEE